MGKNKKKQNKNTETDEQNENQNKNQEENNTDAKVADEKRNENTDENANEEKTKKSESGKQYTGAIVLGVRLHCQRCVETVVKSLKGFDGVEEVEPNAKDSRVTVKGKWADPVKVAEHVRRKTGKHVELISPKPKKEPEKKEQDKKPEAPKVIETVLKMHLHCEGCAKDVKHVILKMEGVQTVNVDMNTSHVTVKEAFDPKHHNTKTSEQNQNENKNQEENNTDAKVVDEKRNENTDENANEKGDEKTKESESSEQYTGAIVLGVHLHCQECVETVVKSLREFDGVEEVEPNAKDSIVTVKGKSVDPVKVVERVRRKIGKHVVLISPKPKKEPEKKEQEKKPEVQTVNVDMNTSHVTVKGAFDPKSQNTKTGELNQNEIQNQEENNTDAEVADEKRNAYTDENVNEKGGENPDLPSGLVYVPQLFSDENPDDPATGRPFVYALQLFSDENPNACSIM